MSKFTINFQANTTGIHNVGWRTYTDAPNTYNIIPVNVITPGAQSVDIDVVGNIYCAESDIQYTGYIIATCQDQVDGNTDGIPDLALTWTVDMLQQIDPCIKTDIACNNVGVATITVVTRGTGFTSIPTIGFTGGGGTGATATATLGDGIVTSLEAWTAGSGYNILNASSTQTVNVLRAGQVGSTGAGMTVDVTFDAGAIITNIVLNAGGGGYSTTDDAAPLTIDLTSLTDGTAPTGEATIDILCSGIFGDEVNDITVDIAGTGYTSIPTITFTGGAGTGATATAIMESCPSLDIGVYDCAGQNNLTDTPDYILSLGESIVVCADISTLGSLATNFVDSLVVDVSPKGNCHCEPCTHVTVSVIGGASGVGKITYQTCWDASNVLGPVVTVTQAINFGDVIDLGCILESTLAIDNGNLTGGVIAVLTSVACT